MHLGPPVRDGALHQLCSRPPEQLYLPHHDITGTCYCFVDPGRYRANTREALQGCRALAMSLYLT